MQASYKILFNTVVLYAKIILSSVASIISIPLILQSLGKSDYGLYSLIAGVVAMLSFLNNSLSISTQRFLSVSLGKNNVLEQNRIFDSSIVLHFMLGVILVVLLELFSIFLFNGFLNIDSNRVSVAKIIYHFIVFSMFCTVFSVPFSAVINAKENMLAYSLIYLGDSLLKLILAFLLSLLPGDKLIWYGFFMCLISFTIACILVVFVKCKYPEYSFDCKRNFDRSMLKQLAVFSGWNTFGSFAMVARNQGVAIVVNLFFGTLANAAYGVANQINGVVSYFSSTFQRALNPQLMQSYGMSNENRLVKFSLISSKYSVLCFILFAIPFFWELPFIVSLWLKDVPEYTIEMARLVLVLSVVYQFSSGLMSGIQAVGKIKWYQITMSVLILFNIPLAFILFNYGCPAYYCFFSMIVLEFISLVVRMIFAKKMVKINISVFLRAVVKPVIIVAALTAFSAYIVHLFMNESFFRVTMSFLISFLVFSISCYLWGFNNEEKDKVLSLLKIISEKMKRKLVKNK